MLDVLIRNGTVVDGSGSAGYRADVGIVGDTIVHVAQPGQAVLEAATVIDATGRVVTPGFIDLHTHSDASFLIDPHADSKLTQGVTLELTGNCGMSFCAPLIGVAKDAFRERMARSGDTLEPTWTDFDGYLSALEKAGSTINVATQVGHGTVRSAVLGMDNRAPDPEELDRMEQIVAESLDAGALAVSTGLWYAPGAYSLTDEVVRFATPTAERGKLYSSHIRSEGDDQCGLFPAHAEAIEIGRRTGARIQISHVKAIGSEFWGRGHELLEGMRRARQEGIDVAGDQYPYTWSSTSFSGAMFARWALVGGRQKTLDRLADSDIRARIKQATDHYIDRSHGATGCLIASFPPDQSLEGRNLQDVADEWGVEPGEAALRLYEGSEGSYVLNSMEEKDLYDIAADPFISVASDGSSLRDEGPLSSGKPHPRSYSTNTRFIEHMVFVRKLVSFEEAIRKMTSLPARHLGLKRRGSIAAGKVADVLVFKPEEIKQHASFADPHRYSTGMEHIFVNGNAAISDGRVSAGLHGRVLRKLED